MTHLITMTDLIEIGIVENFLKENSINCLKKSRFIGGYLEIVAGGNIYGTDIFVNESDYEKAKELIEILNVK